jgi:hypothetical protein
MQYIENIENLFLLKVTSSGLRGHEQHKNHHQANSSRHSLEGHQFPPFVTLSNNHMIFKIIF